MVNLIGSMPDVAALAAVPGAHLHDYGKEPRPGRKLGHVTVCADDVGTLDASLSRGPGARRRLGARCRSGRARRNRSTAS